MTSDQLPITLDALYGHVAEAKRVVIVEDCPDNMAFLTRAAKRLNPTAEIIAVPDLKEFHEKAAGKVTSDTCILCDGFFPDDITATGGPVFNARTVFELARKTGAKFALTTASEPIDVEPAFTRFIVDKHKFIEGSKTHAGQSTAGILPIARDERTVTYPLPITGFGSSNERQRPLPEMIRQPDLMLPSPHFPANRFRIPSGAFSSGRKSFNLI